MKRIFILLVIMMVTLISTCSAATKWEWVYSDAHRTYSIDRSSLKTILADDGSVKSKRCFVKISYDAVGSQNVAKRLGISVNDPSSLYSIFDATFNFYNDTASTASGCLYNPNGSVAYHYGQRQKSVLDGYFSPVYYFLLQEFAGGNAYDTYKSHKLHGVCTYNNSNGKKFRVMYDKLSVYKIDSRIYCKLYIYGYAPDNSRYNSLNTRHVMYDTSAHTSATIRWSAYDDRRGWYVIDGKGSSAHSLYPDSWMEGAYDKVVHFCNENPSWVNRHSGSGVMPKAFVEHPII